MFSIEQSHLSNWTPWLFNRLFFRWKIVCYCSGLFQALDFFHEKCTFWHKNYLKLFLYCFPEWFLTRFNNCPERHFNSNFTDQRNYISRVNRDDNCLIMSNRLGVCIGVSLKWTWRLGESDFIRVPLFGMNHCRLKIIFTWS